MVNNDEALPLIIMSEDEKLITNDDQEDKMYDVVLILFNPEAKQFDELISVKEAREIYHRVFKLDEKMAKNKVISKLEASGETIFNNIDPLFLKDLYLTITKNLEMVLEDLLKLDTKVKLSIDQDEYHILMRTSEDNLAVQADLDEYLLQLKKNPDENLDFQEFPPYAAFEKHEPTKFIGEKKFRDQFKNYDENGNEVPEGSLFKEIDRIRLIYSMICSALDMGLLMNLGIVLNYMPLSNKPQLEVLKKDWGNFSLLYRNPFKKQDWDLVKNYYGEEITMYFCWLEFLTSYFIPLSVISFVCGIIYFVSNSTGSEEFNKFSIVIGVIFALGLPIFSTVFEQAWTRNQAYISWKWGTMDITQIEEQRPEFEGKYEKDPVTGKTKKIAVNESWLAFRRKVGGSAVFFFIMLVVAAVLGLFIYRSMLNKNSIGPTIIGIANAIQIKIFNYVYTYIAVSLNRWENYEFPSEYDEKLTIKLFLFQFINGYISLFYIAFAKRYFEGCNNDDCISELTLQLGTIFLTNFVLNLIEILTPMIITKYKIWKESRKLSNKAKKLSDEELQSKLSLYDTPLSDYMEVVIGYGYVVLFGASFPFTALLFLILIVIEMRVDAWKLCNLTQRPYPTSTNSIGAWLYIIQIMSIVGAGTNVGIIIFTENAFNLDSPSTKWVVFLVLEHALILFKIALALFIPDVSFVVQKGLVWGKRIVDERLYGKLVDVEMVKKSRDLNFTKPSKESPRKSKTNRLGNS